MIFPEKPCHRPRAFGDEHMWPTWRGPSHAYLAVDKCTQPYIILSTLQTSTTDRKWASAAFCRSRSTARRRSRRRRRHCRHRRHTLFSDDAPSDSQQQICLRLGLCAAVSSTLAVSESPALLLKLVLGLPVEIQAECCQGEKQRRGKEAREHQRETQ